MNNAVFIIYNPIAGKGEIKTKLSNIVELFSQFNYTVVLFPTKKRDDAYNKMKEIGNDYSLVVCAGGDGTLNEVVNAYHELHTKPKLGYLPCGTTNDFAKSLKIDKGLLANTKRIIHSTTEKTLDLGSFNNQCFTYVAAFGSISEVSYTTPQKSKNVFGHLAYVLEGLKQFTKLRKHELKIEYDDGIIEDAFCLGMITNSLSIGGFKFYKESDISLNDGYFECILIKNPNNPLDLQQILATINSKKYQDNNHIVVLKTKKLKITSTKSIKWTVDGEYAGKHQECTIENLHEAIRFVV